MRALITGHRDAVGLKLLTAGEPMKLELDDKSPQYLEIHCHARLSPLTIRFKQESHNPEFHVFISHKCQNPSNSQFSQTWTTPNIVKIHDEHKCKEFYAKKIYIGIHATTEVNLSVRARFPERNLPTV